jgi:hypothetical protein
MTKFKLSAMETTYLALDVMSLTIAGGTTVVAGRGGLLKLHSGRMGGRSKVRESAYYH